MELGTDNLFHKRKAKAASDLNRKQAAKQAYAKILIVCEGAKTEPHYFREVVDHYELSTANVCISGEGGSAPRKVVEHGMRLFAAEKKPIHTIHLTTSILFLIVINMKPMTKP